MPGKTSTFVVRVQRDDVHGTPGEAVRFTVAPGDWDINQAGQVQLLPPGTLTDSACAWATFSPAEFSLAPGGMGPVRVSVSAPPDVAPGLYRLGLFFEEHSAVPPVNEATRRLVFRYRLSTMIYVVVPPVEKRISLKLVELRESGGRASVRALLENPGTVFLRPEHWIEIRDAEGRLVQRTERTPTMPLLPGHELDVELALPEGLARSGPLAVRYLVDAGAELPLQAATLSLGGAGSE